MNTTATLLVQEVGTDALTISSAQLSGAHAADFTVNTAVPFMINNGGAAKTVTLTCKPTALGVRTAVLTLATNDPTQATVSYNLICTGVQAPSPSLIQGAATTGVTSPYAMAGSPDGKHIYVTSSTSNALLQGTRNSDTGVVTFGVTHINATTQPLGVAISPDGKSVYLTGYGSDAVTIYSRNESSGMLIKLGVIAQGQAYPCSGGGGICFLDGMDGAFGVTVSPDGKNVYVAGHNSDAIVAFGRDVDSSQLSILHSLKQGSGGVTGMDGARQVAVSPDGGYVYVTSHIAGNDGTIAVFKRDAATGRLTFVTSYSDGVDGLTDLAGASGIVFSPDGGQLYITAIWDKAVNVFQRDAGSGHLTLLESHKDGAGDINSLYGAMSAALSPDGTRLYVAAYVNGTLTVFDRDGTTGKLRYRDAYKDDSAGTTNLGAANGVMVSPDHAHIYVNGPNDSAVAMFKRANPTPLLTSLNPASRPSGSGDFTLTLHGANFVPGARVKWNLTFYDADVLDSTKLTVLIPASQLNTAGLASITVHNPAPTTGSSNVKSFTISSAGQNPVPSITTLMPQGTAVGSPALNVTVTGQGFLSSSKVHWNGSERPTTYVSATELKVALAAGDLALSGPAGISVVTPGPGGGTSNAATFTVVAPDQNPPPSVTQLAPWFAVARGPAGASMVVTVTGSNFVDGAQGQWNGVSRPTTFVSDTQVRVTLLAGDIANGGTGGIQVVNPEPGGGASNTMTFTIFPYALYLPVTIR